MHEIRNLVNAATVAFEVLNTGNVGVSGSTGAASNAVCRGLGELINRAVAEVRLGQGLQDRVTIGVAEFIDELTPAAILEAANRGLRFTVHAADANVAASRPADPFGDRHQSASERLQVPLERVSACA